jgi:hypothetical protein
MKKLMFILTMIPISLYAGPDDTDEICRRNTLVMAVLQTSDSVTTMATQEYLNPDKKRWVIDVKYDIFAQMRPELWDSAAQEYKTHYIYGSATCNGISVRSSPDGKSNNYGPASVGDTNTYLKATSRDAGPNCWCKMDGPVTSWWTYFKQYTDTAEKTAKQLCNENCTQYCADMFRTNGVLGENSDGQTVHGRDALYYTIW